MTPPDQMSPPPEGGWESLKVDELKEELDARGLPKSGNKAELVARLADDDVAQKDNLRAPRGDSSDGPAEGGVTEETAPAENGAPPEEPVGEPPAEDSTPKRRRGSAETSTGTGRRRAAPPRPEDGLIVRARSKYVRSAPRKARLVMNHIRGKQVEQARAILTHAPRAVSEDILKLLNSAVANAESSYELGADELRVMKAFVDEGPTIKRYRPRALGRATRINKRTSHMTIELTTTTGNGR
jgi:large subunit ribosomal protein L22